MKGVMPTANLRWAALCLLTLAILITFIGAYGETSTKIDKSPELQRRRQEFIDSMIRQGVFSKVEPDKAPRVWVTPSFNVLDYETKKTAISIVYAYYFDSMARENMVRILDNRTGKSIGYFTADGLRIY
jgi:hypothetical protein